MRRHSILLKPSNPIDPVEAHDLTWKEYGFVVHYVKNFAVGAAAEAAGYARSYGSTVLERPHVAAAVEFILSKMLDDHLLDATDIMWELWDNHLLARQEGNLSASNTALAHLAKHKRIDANAADKIMLSSDADVVERLEAARKRMKPEKEGVVSFM